MLPSCARAAFGPREITIYSAFRVREWPLIPGSSQGMGMTAESRFDPLGT